MAFRSLDEIKKLRKKYHLNQQELAQRAGVSQSLIAKIESGKVEPSFSKAGLIFEALEQLREKEELKAKQIMHEKVFFVQSHSVLKDVVKVMKSKSISQMPVLAAGKVRGIVSESTIINHIADHPEKINTLTAGEIMEEAPPIVSLNTGLRTLTELLRDYSCVLVAEKGDVKGIISKSDLLGKME